MFISKEWENLGQSKRLRGFRIKVLQYNSGKNANFELEAWGDPFAAFDGRTSAPYVRRTIPGKGPEARKEAIRQAKELAATGLYDRE